MAGIPQLNSALYHRIRFLVGDPVAYVQIPAADGGNEVDPDSPRHRDGPGPPLCPGRRSGLPRPIFTPANGLSGDRETATAQAAAECLRRAGVTRVVADRTLPLIFAELVREAGIGVECDTGIGVADRRRKDPEELEHVRQSQQATEQIIERTCRLIARAEARRDGVLLDEGRPLTSERIRAMINHWFIDLGYVNPPSIIAGGPVGGRLPRPGPRRSCEPASR